MNSLTYIFLMHNQVTFAVAAIAHWVSKLLFCIMSLKSILLKLVPHLPGANELINSSPPGVAYMRWWTGSAVVQVMACCLFSAKPLPKPMGTYCQLDPEEQSSKQNTKLFIEEIAFENVVCEMAAFLSRGRWVKIPFQCQCWLQLMYPMYSAPLPALLMMF